jgi:TPR repeat protein
MCAHNGVAEAMFHLGYAKMYGGFGVGYNMRNIKWIKKAAEAGSYIAKIMYADIATPDNYDFLINSVASSNDNLALGYYHIRVLCQSGKGIVFLEKSANEGNEYGQFWFHEFQNILDKSKMILWLDRAAEQGNYNAQRILGRDDNYWHKRMVKQAGYRKIRGEKTF